MTNTDELKRLAEAADKVAPSPWLVRPQEYDDWGIIRQSEKSDAGFQPIVAKVLASPDDRLDQDAMSAHRSNGTDPYEAVSQHIAAANPSAILSLIEEVEGLRGERDAIHRDYVHAQTNATGWETQAEENAAENERLRAELDKAHAENAELRSCSSIKPKEFDLVKRTEWARLAHEAWGYIHTCHRRHGTDFEGRLHAINGLKEMARVLKETLPASAFTERHKSQGESDE
jgi:hypothetical protein